MRFRFVHAADLHLDTPFRGIGRVSESAAQFLRDASLEAFDALVDLAMDRDAAFVVLAGDIYDGPERGLRAQLRLERGLARMSSKRIQTFIAHGNHDPFGGWRAIRDWPEGVHVFGTGHDEGVAVISGGAHLATVHGISYGQSECRENLALGFERGPGEGLHVGVLHCDLGGTGPYSPCTEEDLLHQGMDYWALGHVHEHRVVRDVHPWIVYPGTLQGRSCAAGECGPKGAVVVEVEDGVVLSTEFVELDQVRFERRVIDVAPIGTPAGVYDELIATADAARAAAGADRGVVLRAELHGRGAGYEDLKRAGGLRSLLTELRRDVEADVPFFWWESLRSVTPALQRNKSDRRDRGPRPELLAAEVLRQVSALAGDRDAQNKLLKECLALISTRGVAQWLPQASRTGDFLGWAIDPDELLQRGEERVLRLLEEAAES